MRTGALLDHFAKTLLEFAKARDCADNPVKLPDLNAPAGLQIIRLFAHAQLLAEDDFLGLADHRCPPGSYRFMSEVAVRCATLRECLQQAFRFIGLACPAAHYSIVEDGKEAIITIRIDGADRDAGVILHQWQLITMHRLAQWLIGAEISLNWAELSHPMEFPFSEYATIFGGDCSFNMPGTRLSFPSHFLDRRIIRTARDVERQFSAPQGNITEPETLSRTWKQLVKRALRINILEESPLSTIDSLAIEFGVSSQTLRRRLKEEGTSYRLLKAEIRREAALDALSDEATSLAEASLRAGFAELNGLTRALRTSTGKGSRQLRNQVLAWQEDKTHH